MIERLLARLPEIFQRQGRRTLIALSEPVVQANLHAALVAAILLVASLVRFTGLVSIGYNSDEAVYSGQAAAIAQAPGYRDLFPVFRAHPLLFQFMLSLPYHIGVNEFTGRALSALIGILTVYVVYRLGETLYGPLEGTVAALFLAVMPYHVIITRQVLLDGPLTLFATLSVLLLARYAAYNQARDLYAAGAALGLTFLTKETGILYLAAVYVFFSLSPEVRFRFRNLALFAAITFSLIALYPLAILLAGGGTSSTAGQYLIWQLSRFPNHSWDFYLRTVPVQLGPLVAFLALAGFWTLRKKRSWRETLLASWVVLPILFFQFWPTKGFQYLVSIAPVAAVLAARTLTAWFDTPSGQKARASDRLLPIAISLVTISLLVPALLTVLPVSTGGYLAGSGGVPGGREAGEWVNENLPEGALLMTIGPSMANILQYYGQHRALGISVSANPLYRNPSYTPIDNPDRQIRLGEIQYLVWDAYSAGRSQFFSDKLLGYAQKYGGRIVHLETIPVESRSGLVVAEPVIIIYRVYP